MKRIIDLIEHCQRFLITIHVRPDGDAIGSELALYHLLVEMGKEVTIYNEDRVPDNYCFMPGSSRVTHEIGAPSGYDVVFVLDCSELERVGSEAMRIAMIPKIVNIDHHLSNDGFASVTLADAEASSTGELIYRLVKTMGRKISQDVATNLYTAILTDTGGFRYSSTSAASLLAAADLVAGGANPQWISEHVYESNPIARIRLLAKVLGTLSLDCDGKVGSMVVTLQDLRDTGALPEHTENFVDLPRTIDGVVLSILYHEIEQGKFKVSFRSKGTFNAERIARIFGGGGHLNAAACRIHGDIESVRRRVLEVIAAG
jgi:phosphoesterase RecJ-like protein